MNGEKYKAIHERELVCLSFQECKDKQTSKLKDGWELKAISKYQSSLNLIAL